MQNKKNHRINNSSLYSVFLEKLSTEATKKIHVNIIQAMF